MNKLVNKLVTLRQEKNTLGESLLIQNCGCIVNLDKNQKINKCKIHRIQEKNTCIVCFSPIHGNSKNKDLCKNCINLGVSIN